jgi:hypothetical protein
MLSDIIGRVAQWLVSGPRYIPEQPPLSVDVHGWLVGTGVTIIPSHSSWIGGTMDPGGAVCHVSATKPGTALAMARRRARKFGEDPNDRLASWHASVEADGELVQQVSFKQRAWHAGSSTAKPIPGLGWANAHACGFELIGFEKGPFPDAQVFAYARLLRAFVREYDVKVEHAMVTHASIDPSRRSDPGKPWMSKHATSVIEYAYRSQP